MVPRVISLKTIYMLSAVTAVLVMCAFPAQGATTFVSPGSMWRYVKGTSEPSTPTTAWREPDFDDRAWASGPAPFRYGDGSGGTELDDMRNNYSTVFLRTTFPLGEETTPDALRLTVNYDDGFILWINGLEVESVNAPAAPAHDAFAPDGHESGSFQEYRVPTAGDYLRVGTNIVAVQVFNTSLSSSDIHFDMSLVGLLLAGDTKFSVDRGFYEEPFEVEITTTTEGASIRYTTDASVPTETSGTTYTGPLTITTTTILRAAAFKAGFDPSNVDTQTYIFLKDVIRQEDRAPLGAFWDTEMDPDVVDDPRYRDTILDALTSIPTISIVAEPVDLFSTEGIHWGSNLENRNLEVPASVELIYPNKRFKGFQEDCGLRIQGGGGRWDEGTYDPKQSFTLKFQTQYGAGKLRYPFFESAPLNRENAVRTFDRLILRAGHNKSWPGPGPGEQKWVTYTRDQWARDTHIDMCGLDSHGTFTHLYLNGLYWGLYNPVERPDHNFLAAYFGGDGDQYYARKKKGGTVEGNDDRYDEMRSVVEDSDTPYEEIQEYLDTANYIDWHLVMWSCGVADLQWYAGNCVDPGGPVRFWVWDAEDSWDPAGRANDGYRWMEESDVFKRIKDHPEFRMELADRIYKHCFNDGVLTDEKNLERWYKLCDTVEDAVIGESARWGDRRRHPPLNRNDDWYDARDMVAGFMAGNTAKLVNDLHDRGYYPDTKPPVLSRCGGLVNAGFELSMENPNGGGTIYLTLDGTDPRIRGTSEIAAAAEVYTAPLVIPHATAVTARVKSGSEWSPLTKAFFYVWQPFHELRITEIMYHPPDHKDIEGSEYEFIELKNTGTVDLDLSGVQLTGAIAFVFVEGMIIRPGEFAVIVSNPHVFSGFYPDCPFAGTYSRNLSNAGETIEIRDPDGSIVTAVSYDDAAPWPADADGSGYSLVPVDSDPAGDPNDPAYWRLSTEIGGSPGFDDTPSGERPLQIVKEPEDATVTEGEFATFSISTEGYPPPGYQWRRDGTDIPGATAETYTSPPLILGDDGVTFTCVVTNTNGSIESREAVVTVLPRVVQFKRGDVNTDNTLNLADAIYILSYCFAEGSAPTCLDAADTNDDGSINLADTISVLSHLFASSGDLPEPFGECGVDPTIDQLSCTSYQPCQE